MKAGDQMKRTVGFLGVNIRLNKIQNKGLV